MRQRLEKAGLNETLVEVSALPETMVWRNNTGSAWQGKRMQVRPGQTITVRPGMVVLQEARFISFGLEGSGDILGATAGHPLSIEMKTTDNRQQEKQGLFERAWVKAGGIYVLAHSADEALTILRQKGLYS